MSLTGAPRCPACDEPVPFDVLSGPGYALFRCGACDSSLRWLEGRVEETLGDAGDPLDAMLLLDRIEPGLAESIHKAEQALTHREITHTGLSGLFDTGALAGAPRTQSSIPEDLAHINSNNLGVLTAADAAGLGNSSTTPGSSRTLPGCRS